MLQVRKVQVGDVKLQTVVTARGPGRDDHETAEGVRLKAETRHLDSRYPDGLPVTRSEPGMLDWASLHMNLSLQDAVAPGAELLMAVADTPGPDESNMFSGELGHPTSHGAPNFSMEGYVNAPKDDDLFSFVITPDGGGDTYEVRFHGYQAHRFIRALLYEWCSGLQK